MALVECRECGSEVSDQAATCPKCGIKTPSLDKVREKRELQNQAEEKAVEWGSYVLKGAGVIFVLWLIFSGTLGNVFRGVTNSVIASCEVVSVNVKEEVFVTNGEFDYGVLVTAVIERSGLAGNVDVTAVVSSSEGDLENYRSIYLDANQRETVTLQFPDLTVNATNIQGRASCTAS